MEVGIQDRERFINVGKIVVDMEGKADAVVAGGYKNALVSKSLHKFGWMCRANDD